MTPSELLERLARTLKSEVGPAVEGEYPRTQAFLTAVVLEKLAAELRGAGARGAADAHERATLERDLAALLDAGPVPATLRSALTDLPAGGDAGLCRFVEALYAARTSLGEQRFAALLGRVRRSLRAGLERRMEYAG